MGDRSQYEAGKRITRIGGYNNRIIQDLSTFFIVA